MIRNAGDVDHFTHEHVFGAGVVGVVGMANAELDLGAGFTAELAHRLVHCPARGVLSFDFNDLVAAADSRALGGRAVDGRHHSREIIAERDQHAEAAELAARRDHQVFVVEPIQILAVRVELGEHPVDRLFHELVGVDLVHIIL
jgi:hypothetical protein